MVLNDGPHSDRLCRDDLFGSRNVARTSLRVVRISMLRKCLAALLIAAVCVTADGSNAQDLQPGKTFQDCPECPVMVVIPAGHFLMGSSIADTERDFAAVPKDPSGFSMDKVLGFTEEIMAKRFMAWEAPQHAVTIQSRFALGEYLVTVGEYAAFVHETGYWTGPCVIWGHRYPNATGDGWLYPGFNQTDRDPVVCVNWDDAEAYVYWLNQKFVGKKVLADGEGPYRLPSESEWEYAARAGTHTARWWGDDIGTDNAKCDGCGVCSSRSPSSNNGDVTQLPRCMSYQRQTAPVGSYPANTFGLYDMLGNVWEWTQDCWNPTYKGAPTDGSSWQIGNCGHAVQRGGAWNNYPWSLRSTTRTHLWKQFANNSTGFRLARLLQ